MYINFKDRLFINDFSNEYDEQLCLYYIIHIIGVLKHNILIILPVCVYYC